MCCMRLALLGLSLCVGMAALDQRHDLSGDGGVFKTLLREGSGTWPRDGQVATLKFVGTLEDGSVFEEASAAAIACGAEGTLRGLDVAASSMLVGERARYEVRFDYGYGERGLAGKVPGRATLFYECELLDVVDATSSDEPLALPAEAANPDMAGGVRTVEVDGQPVSLDSLGPMVVNKDGTLSRITNWPEMTDKEQANTLRIIAKRNKKRLKDLKEATPDL